MRRFVTGACALLGVACDGGDWIVGEEASREPRAAPDLGAPDLLDPESCPSAEWVLAERGRALGMPSMGRQYVGLWRGTLDGDAVPSFPSTELELELDTSGAGTLTFAMPAGDALATTSEVLDPGIAYLCEAAEGGVFCGTPSGFVGNFAYPIASAQSRGSVLSFVLPWAAPWDGWCALQPPVRWPDPAQPCGFSFGVRSPATPRYSSLGCSRDGEPIDCALMYTLERCQCARDACFASGAASLEVGLELSEDANLLAGSLWNERENDAATVALRRAP